MFINSLTNHFEDGRIVCNTQSIVGKGVLKFLLLNPAVHFKEIVEKARYVKNIISTKLFDFYINYNIYVII